ncbi:MAG: extracellular solute-binding protein, partial [Anaerolineae bacterium]|nr:extracellular solute-binding protein [Anaerolineae bacterium]
MSKRLFILGLIAVTLLVGTFTAAAQDPVELVFHGWGNDSEIAVFTALVEQFNAANPDIRILYEAIPGDYVGTLTTNIAGGTAPDIAYIPDGNFSAFVSRGQLVSLQPFIEASEVINPDGIWPSALGRYRWDEATRSLGTGDIYALPKDIGPTVLYINEDLFEAAGVPLPDPTVPMTWDQLLEIGRAITVDAEGRHPGDEGFDRETVEVFGIGDLWYENIVYGNGGRIISEDGRTFMAAADPNTIEAIQFISDLNH